MYFYDFLSIFQKLRFLVIYSEYQKLEKLAKNDQETIYFWKILIKNAKIQCISTFFAILPQIMLKSSIETLFFRKNFRVPKNGGVPRFRGDPQKSGGPPETGYQNTVKKAICSYSIITGSILFER